MTDLLSRIDALDDKQAIHIANALVQTVFSTSPTLKDLDDEAQLGFVYDETGIRPQSADADVPSGDSGTIARNALRILAQSPDGEAVVSRALDTWFDTKADFGILSVPVGIALVWFIAATDVEFTIGTFHFHKKGLDGDQQAQVAKDVLPGVIKAAAGSSPSS